MEKELSRLRCGESATVMRMDTSQPLQRRLRSFGFVPGIRVGVLNQSPDGSVMALEVCDTVIAMRKTDLQKIRVALP